MGWKIDPDTGEDVYEGESGEEYESAGEAQEKDDISNPFDDEPYDESEPEYGGGSGGGSGSQPTPDSETTEEQKIKKKDKIKVPKEDTPIYVGRSYNKEGEQIGPAVAVPGAENVQEGGAYGSSNFPGGGSGSQAVARNEQGEIVAKTTVEGPENVQKGGAYGKSNIPDKKTPTERTMQALRGQGRFYNPYTKERESRYEMLARRFGVNEPSGPRKKAQQEILEQLVRGKNFKETKNEITETERNVLIAGQTDIQAAEAGADYERIEEQQGTARQRKRQWESQLEKLREMESEELQGIHLTRQEAIERAEQEIEELEKFLKYSEEVTQPSLKKTQERGEAITAEGLQESQEEFIKAENLSNEELIVKNVVEGWGGQLKESAEVVAERPFAALGYNKKLYDIPGVEGEPKKAFNEQLPELSEAQERISDFALSEQSPLSYVGLTEKNIEEAEERIEAGQKGFMKSDIPGPVKQTVYGFSEFGQVGIIQAPEFFAVEVPEKAMETPTLASLGGATLKDPEQSAKEVVSGGQKFVGEVIEKPIQFGWAETAPDLLLDLAVPGVGVVMAQPQVQAQTQAELKQQLETMEKSGSVDWPMQSEGVQVENIPSEQQTPFERPQETPENVEPISFELRTQEEMGLRRMELRPAQTERIASPPATEQDFLVGGGEESVQARSKGLEPDPIQQMAEGGLTRQEQQILEERHPNIEVHFEDGEFTGFEQTIESDEGVIVREFNKQGELVGSEEMTMRELIEEKGQDYINDLRESGTDIFKGSHKGMVNPPGSPLQQQQEQPQVDVEEPVSDFQGMPESDLVDVEEPMVEQQIEQRPQQKVQEGPQFDLMPEEMTLNVPAFAVMPFQKQEDFAGEFSGLKPGSKVGQMQAQEPAFELIQEEQPQRQPQNVPQLDEFQQPEPEFEPVLQPQEQIQEQPQQQRLRIPDFEDQEDFFNQFQEEVEEQEAETEVLPSAEAILFDVRGELPEKTELSGLELRPLPLEE